MTSPWRDDGFCLFVCLFVFCVRLTSVQEHKTEMPPKKKSRVHQQIAKSGEDDGALEDDCADQTAGRKRKAPSHVTENQERAGGSESRDGPQYYYWLMKSEPESRFEKGVDVKFGIDDLKALPNQTGCWDGVRNYQACNFMRQMKEGQLAFFYHSNCKEPGIAGLMKIVKEAYVDHTQFDKKDVHFDSTSKPDNPKWSMVDVQYQRMMKRFLTLSELKVYHLQHRSKGGPLKDVALFTRARLSVQPLTSKEFDFILSMEDKEPL
ncbi:thymocyte nuclear protein 1 isoform X3 [Thalassophryne amazonica]|uniref:thymocyte nuclear protein 1 isoform X3 n=1 Tax=Thalassophryne amazonica TaxID=390379 RepID=UPI0014711C77|nr:thymocyte nuclear protein 1 isoform X3 [Thalassophryne amazonica]